MHVMNLDPTLSSDCEELHLELFNSDAHVTLKPLPGHQPRPFRLSTRVHIPMPGVAQCTSTPGISRCRYVSFSVNQSCMISILGLVTVNSLNFSEVELAPGMMGCWDADSNWDEVETIQCMHHML